MTFILGILIVLSNLILVTSPFQGTLTSLSIVQADPKIFYLGESELVTPEEIRHLIQNAGDTWVKRDAKGFAALFTKDGEFIVPGDRWVGQAEIEKAAANFFANYSEVKIVIRRIIVEGNQAAVEWRWEDKEKASVRRSQADDAIIVDFKDGQITRWREYIDAQTLASE